LERFSQKCDSQTPDGSIESKNTVEQMRLIQQLDDEDKQTIFRLIEKMFIDKKFKEVFQKNVAAL